CGQQTSPPSTEPLNIAVKPQPVAKGNQQPRNAPQDSKQPQLVQVNFGPDDDQTHYETAVQEAFTLLGQKKYPEALASLQAAPKFKHSEFVQLEIKKLRLRIDKQNAAEHTLQDIQSVLDQGKAGEAALLANDALKEFGDTDIAPKLVQLKLQADTLAAAQVNDNAARAKALRDQ